MKSFPFTKLDLPSAAEMQQAVDIGHEVVAISAVNNEHRMSLKILCHNGEQTVVWLDAFMIDHLFRHFESVLVDAQSPTASSSVRTKFIRSRERSLGVVPQSHS